MSIIKNLMAFFLIASLQACVSVPPPMSFSKAPSDQDAFAKTFPVRQNTATVYIYRANFAGKAFTLDFKVNDKSVGGLPGYGYFALELPAGTYKLKSKADNEVEMQLAVENGKSYYVWYDIRFGMLVGTAQFRLMDPKEAQSVIKSEGSMTLANGLVNIAR